MWFKQLTPFRLSQLPETRQLDESLGNHWFTKTQGLDWFSEGFTHPSPFTDCAVFEANSMFETNGSLLVSLKREEKVLPGAVIKHKLDEKVDKIQTAEARNVGRKEKAEIRQSIIDDLLPKALTKSCRTYGLLTNGWLWVDTANSRKAENMLTKMREALGGLSAQMPTTKQSPLSLMTEWLLQGSAQGRFELDYDVTLIGAGDVAPKIKVSRKDLTDDDVVQHVRNGMRVTELGLVWDDRIAFILTQNCTLKRIQWLDMLTEKVEEYAEDSHSRAVAEQTIMTATLNDMLTELVDLLGGWQE
ncbi:recombination-associated protein RdgC [Neisseria sp. S1]|uniref:recombination-associated protein RdgC n=1 Tax=Neisseria sp. S1 TaxID=3318354 RepID=UPI003A88FE92